MTGISVGWFEPTAIVADPAGLVKAIKNTFGPRLRRTKAWPFAVSSLRHERKGVGVAYALIGGHVPIHKDTVGMDDSDGRIFQFVLEVENRPALLLSPERDETALAFLGCVPPTQAATFPMGGVELRVGHAIHFDITTTWHGITGMPVDMESLQDDIAPRAVIVQVSGFAADQIGAAVDAAAYWIAADIAASSHQ
jgi:hypothetical protein